MAVDVRSCNPVTGEVVYSTRAVTRGELDSALMTAVDAWPAWAATPVAQRAQILNAFADLVDEHRDRLATSITAEVGKRSSDSAAEVEWTALSARWYAEHPPEEEEFAGALICRVPLGVIAAVTPWNVPLVTPSWKWLPALMAGNAVVWKPSELATGIAVEAASLFEQAGLPPGLLQVLPGGADVARWLCADPRVAGVHFTGSTRAGRALNQLVAPRFARIALEMGGVNAAVVFADADLERAAEAIIASATALAGQKCTAVRRVLVHREVATVLTDELRRRMENLVVGAPGCDGTDVGSMVSGAARRSAEATLDAAVSRGASVLARAKRSQDATAEAYFPPVLLGDLPLGDPLTTEEVFAPILLLEVFDGQDVWSRANIGGYGLSGAVYTTDPTMVAQARQRLSVGVLAVNGRSDAVGLEQPFGGRGLSGNGRPEGGSYAYSAVTDTVVVYDHGMLRHEK
ncbi:MAG: aldehyde dehydrogenase family protein [Ornithinimicrobium sp.]|uniref:aldehyde dehydrogenase family protein n=1 Tax=Ornithinimicrobium sp. TaxID=1977084 RepID=UPI003D9B1044